MGVLIYQDKSKFMILQASVKYALDLLYKDASVGPRIAHIIKEAKGPASSQFVTAMSMCGFLVTGNYVGDIVDIKLNGEKLTDQFQVLSIIAPTVQRGSYIQVYSREGDVEHWRWVFDGNRCEEVKGKLYFTKHLDKEVLEEFVESLGKMEEGYEGTMVVVECPNCDTSEKSSTAGVIQFENFEAIGDSERFDGYRFWFCKKCGTMFYTKIE